MDDIEREHIMSMSDKERKAYEKKMKKYEKIAEKDIKRIIQPQAKR
jgi:hypothetical protein